MSYEDCVRDFLGLGMPATLRILAERLGRPVPEGWEMELDATVRDGFRRELTPVPGIEEALEEIELPACVAPGASTAPTPCSPRWRNCRDSSQVLAEVARWFCKMPFWPIVRQTDPMPGADHDSVLFDLDGVLVDSRAAIAGCINHALVEHQFAARPPGDLHRFIGPSLADAFAELTGHPSESAVVASCLSSYRDRYVEASLQETIVTPGIEIALGELAQGYGLAIATSKPLAFAEPLLSTLELRPFFTAVAGPDLSERGESKASTIATALRMLGLPKRAVMVGDRSHDIVGAQSHSLPCIGVTWGIGSIKELRDAGADSIVDVPAELAESVKQLLGDASDRGAGAAGQAV